MNYKSLTVLIPSHSVEDLPLDLPEEQAEGLLNAFAVVWHPMLLDAAGALPTWERGDQPPEDVRERLFIVPAVSEGWIPCQWVEAARERGAIVVTGVAERAALLEQVLGPLERHADCDPDLVQDFLALGHCYLQLEILTRQMRYFSELDRARMQSEAVSAARAALAGDRKAAESHLHTCFEMLLEGRERFYPVDCYLADLCLLTPEMAGDEWAGLVRSGRLVNFLVTAQDLQTIADEHSEVMTILRDHWRDGRQELLGGEWTETGSALLPLESVLPSFRKGLAAIQRICGRRPAVWARRKYGVGIQVPQLLDKLGYTAALRFVIDDGIYPDEEQGKHRWEGCDGSVIDAISRIPLAGDSASGMLRFPQRMAESMDYDHAALLILARWPRLQTPWLEDFHRIERYAPVLGRFVTFTDFFATTDTPGRLSRHKAGDYLSPHLVAAVAREESDPISRYADHWARHHRREATLWMSGMADVLSGRTIDGHRFEELERLVEAGDPPPDGEVRQQHEKALTDAEHREARRLAETIVGRQGDARGGFITNACSFSRRVVVAWPPDVPPPGSCPAILARQWHDDERYLVVELPPCGFVWLPEGEVVVPKPKKGATAVPLAEVNVLRNEFFEVRLSDVTGGIAQVRTYRRGPNRLSQQLALRFPRELTVRTEEEGDVREEKTWYSQMQVLHSQVTSDGPAKAEIETTGELVDPTTGAAVARFNQRFRVWRALPLIEIDVTLEPLRLPEGSPWSSYYAIRWAWNDPAAAVTCSVHEGAHPVTSERFEAPHFIEIVEDEQRTTIHPLGLPFHRKTGTRMLDTLLITAGESRRQFRFVVSVDEPYPFEPARGVLQPARAVFLDDGPPQPTAGWLLHVDSRNVQITRLMPLPPDGDALHRPANAKTGETDGGFNTPTPAATGVRLRLRETEGRGCTAKLRCFRSPTSARKCDFLDRPITDLSVEGDAVIIPLSAYEVSDVTIHWT